MRQIAAGELVEHVERRVLRRGACAGTRPASRDGGRARVGARAREPDLLGQRGARAAVERRARRSWQNTRCSATTLSRQLEPRLAVALGVRADVDHREPQIRVPEDDVVHPRRDAAGDERVGPLDQQADVRAGAQPAHPRRRRCIVRHAPSAPRVALTHASPPSPAAAPACGAARSRRATTRAR